jgi:hypothetical protein
VAALRFSEANLQPGNKKEDGTRNVSAAIFLEAGQISVTWLARKSNQKAESARA